MATENELIVVQHKEFPGSHILTKKDVMNRWLLLPRRDGGVGYTYNERAATSIASTLLQYPVIVFYEWHGHRGARYGVEGHQYISGFGTEG